MIVGLELLLLSHSVTDYDYDCDYYLLNAEVRKRVLVLQILEVYYLRRENLCFGCESVRLEVKT